MQVSMSNQKRIESAIKNLEVQVGQLAKQLANRPSSIFGANTEKNLKKECKVVMTRRKRVSMNEGEKRIGEEKQQLVTEPAIDPVMEPLSETEEEVEVEDDQQKETPIIVSEKEINEEKEKEEKEKDKEKENEKMRKMKKKKREKKRRKKARVSGLERKRKKHLQLKGEKYHIPWYLLGRTKKDI